VGSDGDRLEGDQTFTDFEVIIVDVRENPDVWRARNAGVAEAAGEWIAFVEPGDIWLPERLAEQAALARDADLIYSDCYFRLRETLSPVTFHKLFPPPRPGEDPVAALIDRGYIPYAALAVRADTFRAAGGFDPAAGPAAYLDLCLRLLARGARSACVARPLVHHRVRLDRITETQVEAQRAQERVLHTFAKAHPEYRPAARERAHELAREYVERDRARRRRFAARLGDSAKLVEARAPLGELLAQGLYLVAPTAAGWMGKLVEPSSAADYLNDLILCAEPAPADPKVSVVIPCHNYGRFLAKAVESALDQTHADLEIIIVDDGSTDDTAEVASRYNGKALYWYQPDSGPGAARNTGINLSSGHYIAFLDADDWLEPAFVAECLRALGEHPDAAYAFPQVFFFGRREAISQFPRYDSASATRRRIPSCSVFRHQAFAAVRFDEGLRTGLEDWDLFHSLEEHGARGVLVDRPLVHVRTHESGGSMTDRLIASPHRRRGLYFRLMLRHFPLFTLGDWTQFLNLSGREFLGETKRWVLRRGGSRTGTG
jgi:glycosyltransferase involved in cell wall biosynthesis